MIGGKSFSLTLHEFEDDVEYIWSNPRFNVQTWYQEEDRLLARVKKRFWTARWRHDGEDWQELHFAELTTLLAIMDHRLNAMVEIATAQTSAMFFQPLRYYDEASFYKPPAVEALGDKIGWHLTEFINVSLVNPRLNERTNSHAIKWMVESAKRRLRSALGLDKEVKT
ncbi:hypothetical protein EVC12_202 [Rhizobium phage RHph_I42]|nr:hypothetical protein EVC12_202 [Rhizobium phage RHph_I42]